MRTKRGHRGHGSYLGLCIIHYLFVDDLRSDNMTRWQVAPDIRRTSETKNPLEGRNQEDRIRLSVVHGSSSIPPTSKKVSSRGTVCPIFHVRHLISVVSYRRLPLTETLQFKTELWWSTRRNPFNTVKSPVIKKEHVFLFLLLSRIKGPDPLFILLRGYFVNRSCHGPYLHCSLLFVSLISCRCKHGNRESSNVAREYMYEIDQTRKLVGQPKIVVKYPFF